ncbi:MAG: hypothetical protein KAS96_12670 [Planctomycetes bacterium]|nr:hypothetical protein [Planctomycetota bacterium]
MGLRIREDDMGGEMVEDPAIGRRANFGGIKLVVVWWFSGKTPRQVAGLIFWGIKWWWFVVRPRDRSRG